MFVLFEMPNIWLKIFSNVQLTYVAIECRIVPSYMYGLSGLPGNLLPVLVNNVKLEFKLC